MADTAATPENGCLFVYITMPDKASAVAYCETLVQERLAACANILDRAASVYWWQGALEKSDECVCVLKTTRARYPAFFARAMETHPYETPCIVVWPLETGNSDFLTWIHTETTPR